MLNRVVYRICFLHISKIFIVIEEDDYMKKFLSAVSEIGRLPIRFYKSGSSIVILALTGIYLLCENDVRAGGVGVELYYAPMLDYILTAFLIFWAGMFILDLAEKEYVTK